MVTFHNNDLILVINEQNYTILHMHYAIMHVSLCLSNVISIFRLYIFSACCVDFQKNKHGFAPFRNKFDIATE